MAPHSLYYLSSTPACDQAPLLYLIYFLFCFTQLRKRSPNEVDLGIDIWLSGCASWKRLAEAETAAKLFSSVSRLPELCDLAETGLDFFLFYVFGGVHALPVWLPIHCTIFPALQPVIRPPYYYILLYFLFSSPSSETVAQRGGSRHRYLALWVC